MKQEEENIFCFDCKKPFRMDDDPILFNGDKLCGDCCAKRAEPIVQNSLKSLYFGVQKMSKAKGFPWRGRLEEVRQIQQEWS